MAILNLFSKRKSQERGEINDVYNYDEIPETLRVQIVHIWDDVLGNSSEYWRDDKVTETYKFIAKALCREYGKFTLTDKFKNRDINYYEDLKYFLLKEENSERIIDAIEFSFKVIDKWARDYHYRPIRGVVPDKRVDSAINELNIRFRENSIGYQYENGKIIRIDSEYLHSEIVKPILELLKSEEFKGVNDEFLNAHEHYRKGENKECLNYCLKSFESMMKSVCRIHDWRFNKNDTAKTLLDICFKNKLIPSFWQSHFSSLRSMLESGVPTGRNKLSGHGQGNEVVKVPTSVVSYILHSTAAAIKLFADVSRNINNV